MEEMFYEVDSTVKTWISKYTVEINSQSTFAPKPICICFLNLRFDANVALDIAENDIFIACLG